MIPPIIGLIKLVTTMLILVYAINFALLSKSGALFAMSPKVLSMIAPILTMIPGIIAMTKPIISGPIPSSR